MAPPSVQVCFELGTVIPTPAFLGTLDARPDLLQRRHIKGRREETHGGIILDMPIHTISFSRSRKESGTVVTKDGGATPEFRCIEGKGAVIKTRIQNDDLFQKETAETQVNDGK